MKGDPATLPSRPAEPGQFAQRQVGSTRQEQVDGATKQVFQPGAGMAPLPHREGAGQLAVFEERSVQGRGAPANRRESIFLNALNVLERYQDVAEFPRNIEPAQKDRTHFRIGALTQHPLQSTLTITVDIAEIVHRGGPQESCLRRFEPLSESGIEVKKHLSRHPIHRTSLLVNASATRRVVSRTTGRGLSSGSSSPTNPRGGTGFTAPRWAPLAPAAGIPRKPEGPRQGHGSETFRRFPAPPSNPLPRPRRSRRGSLSPRTSSSSYR